MPWHAPLTADNLEDYSPTAVVGTPNWAYDADNIRWIVRAQSVLADQVDAVNTDNNVVTDLLATGTGDTIQPFVLPANILGTKGMLRLRLLGGFHNETGLNERFHQYLEVAGIRVWESTTDDIDPSGKDHTYELRLFFCNCGAVDSNMLWGSVKFGIDLLGDAGIGSLHSAQTQTNGPFIIPIGSRGKLTIDTSVEVTFKFLHEQFFPSDQLGLKKHWVCAELVGQAS